LQGKCQLFGKSLSGAGFEVFLRNEPKGSRASRAFPCVVSELHVRSRQPKALNNAYSFISDFYAYLSQDELLPLRLSVTSLKYCGNNRFSCSYGGGMSAIEKIFCFFGMDHQFWRISPSTPWISCGHILYSIVGLPFMVS
jgi:hypothetical protein